VVVMRRRPSRRTLAIAGGALAFVHVAGTIAGAALRPRDPVIEIGFTGERISTPPTTAAVVLQPPTTEAAPETTLIPEPGPAVGLKTADGQPAPPAIEFTSDIPVPDHLVFVLVLGSDARPREELTATRSDSIHLLALNPMTGQGTIVGFPRDSYVQFPDGRRGKINDAMARGGPRYVAETIRHLTGLPVDYYVLTGFDGLMRMVDDLGGVDVRVDRRMNDSFSGARFQPGWHHFTGGEALAFSRDRHDVADGDFTRSLHQGQVLLATLAKLRSEVGDDAGLFRWLAVLGRSCRLDVPAAQLPSLAALARRMAPDHIRNVVLPGRIGTAGSASVVYLTQDAPQLFVDLRDDAVIGTASGSGPASTTTTAAPPAEAPSSTTSSTAPTTTAPPTTEAPSTVTVPVTTG
jgi:LCP family protein required for cell wall assembly